MRPATKTKTRLAQRFQERCDLLVPPKKTSNSVIVVPDIHFEDSKMNEDEPYFDEETCDIFFELFLKIRVLCKKCYIPEEMKVQFVYNWDLIVSNFCEIQKIKEICKRRKDDLIQRKAELLADRDFWNPIMRRINYEIALYNAILSCVSQLENYVQTIKN